MIAEIGRGLLWLACACAGLAAVAELVPRARLGGLAVPAAVLGAWLWIWIAGGSAWVFVQDDMSVAAVAENSHSHLPVSLKLAAIVLRDGGGWVTAAALAALAGAGVAVAAARRGIILGAICALSFGVHAALLVVDPFARLDPAPTEGAGFPSVWRDRLGRLAPPGAVVADAILEVGAAVRDGGTRVGLVAVTPDAGPDSTEILVEVRVTDGSAGPIVLIPRWRETNVPLHAAPVADSALTWSGWYAATLGMPRADGRWPVRVTRLDWRPKLAVLVVLAVGVAVTLGQRRR